METYFASPQKADPFEIEQMADRVINDRILSSILEIVDGCLAVLNEHRQILALNKNILDMLGIDDAEKALGLRPGEALHCVHANKHPGGCGTTEFCSSCGAAIAIVTSLSKNSPVERTCAINVDSPHGPKDIYFRVRSQPVLLNDQKYLLLFLQDITKQQQWAIIERIFFHDVNNLIGGLANAGELLALQQPANPLTDIIQKLAGKLSNEIQIQQHLNKFGISDFKPDLEETTAETILQDTWKTFAETPIAKDKNLIFKNDLPPVSLKTNPALISRILTNMMINALEASTTGDAIHVWCDMDGHCLRFNVQNRQKIPDDIAKRIFQRNFSTKQDMGRGWGTYSMKLLGEKILNGRVGFSTSEKNGTTFWLSLPLRPAPA
jgi:hypothetical protein